MRRGAGLRHLHPPAGEGPPRLLPGHSVDPRQAGQGRRDLVRPIRSGADPEPGAAPGTGEVVDGEQPPVEQDRDPIGDAFDLGKDVRGDKDRAVAGQGPQQAAQLDDLARVEAVGRLVEHQQLGLVQHGLGDRDALPVAARQPADDDVADRPEREPRDARPRCLGASAGPRKPRNRPMKWRNSSTRMWP